MFSAWSDSHHAAAWQLPTPKSVLGDFDDASYKHHGFDYHFLTRDGANQIVADGQEGKPVAYPVRYVVGVTPLQQYLVDIGRGRLQALDVAWDTQRKRWFHLYPDQWLKAGGGDPGASG
ncbi:MAG: hypothetical protein OI74_08030 [Gammaproteobacteria bacterium (ex Lamellibrachia satsuma)]|nr:MAG: hypothetical protein HPY30_03990 [Gammaproteobacteria bacterium (ex Lamellibrachia satsuma)]RRS33411.1 MAG: hypothetical protein OI74_08030 [Gammaproteobacteria bacterium (ex Lamellibrachia satsuma)]RRS35064.1 MAG: hypothetical protein NV67_11660 [Gammaproteobacteria bacterium (ex Lamellibrachia satsuma)]